MESRTSSPQLPNMPLLADIVGRRARFLLDALGPLLALVLVFGFFAAADSTYGGGTFATSRSVRTILVQAAPIAVAALGMTVIIIAGGIDLSAGTSLALCATVLALALRQGFSPSVAVAGCLLTGCACGLLNGGLIALLRVKPFIVTLGTMTAFLGIAKMLADETTVRPHPNQIPAWLPAMVKPSPDFQWMAVASGVWLLVLLAIVLSLVLRQTVFGRYVFALGSNEATARLCGINVPLVKIAVYTLAGAFVGIAGMYQFARLSSGNPTSGIGLELKMIAAVVIGGGSLSGGRGTALGTLSGALLTQVIASGCTQLELSNPWQDVLLGIIIIAAVTIDQLRQRGLNQS
jgi:ribose transport system permease protein